MKIVREVAVIILAAAIILAFAAGWYSHSYFNPPMSMDQVTLELNWVRFWNKAAYFVGLDKGFYAKYGISVSIVPGAGSRGAVTDLDMKKVEFAEPYMSTLMSGVAEGAKIKAIGVIWEYNTNCVIYINGSGIEKPTDLNGKVCAAAPKSAVVYLWPAFCEKTGIDIHSVEMVLISAGAYPAYLVERKCDFVLSSVGQYMTCSYIGAQQGLEVAAMLWEDYGITFAGTSLACHEDLIKERPDLVRRFVRATYEAYEWHYLHPEESADIMMKYEATLDPEFGRYYLKEMARIHAELYEGRTGLQYGWIDPKKIESMVEVVAEGLGIENPPAPEDIYTNEFVEAPPTT